MIFEMINEPVKTLHLRESLEKARGSRNLSKLII